MKILVIDDSSEYRNRWRNLLEILNHDVIEAEDGYQGIEVMGKLGQPVNAAVSGEVVYSGSGVKGYGNLIIIKHNENYLSAYAFNEKRLVSLGQKVKAGQEIALMGRNNAGKTLLYFEIRKNGKPVDPLKYLG